MHGTLPVSEEQALASLRDAADARVSVAALAREWGWSRGKVRHRLDGWRKNGDLPPVPKRRTTRRNPPAAPSVPAVAPAPAPVPAVIPAVAAPAPAHSSTGGF